MLIVVVNIVATINVPIVGVFLNKKVNGTKKT
jgi:uncharacterized membrane protein YqaE (UPF0057 family)